MAETTSKKRLVPRNSIRRGMADTMFNTIWKDDSYMNLSPEKTEEYREKSRQIIKNLDPDFMEKPKDMASGETIIPYIHIEKDVYGLYFREGGYDNFFEPGITRIACKELKFDRSLNYMREYMTLKTILEIIIQDPDESSQYDEDLNGLSYRELFTEYQFMLNMLRRRTDLQVARAQVEPDERFKIVKIESFEEAHKYLIYTDRESPWCLSNEERKYKKAVGPNKRMTLYFILMDGYEDIKRPATRAHEREWADIDYSLIGMPEVEDRPLAYDKYGLSMMIVFVDRDGRLVHSVPRYNHDLNEYSRDFLDEYQLTMLLGRNFYEAFPPKKD